MWRSGKPRQHRRQLRTEAPEGQLVGREHRQLISDRLFSQVIALVSSVVQRANPLALEILQGVDLGLEKDLADSFDFTQLGRERLEAAGGELDFPPFDGEREAIVG